MVHEVSRSSLLAGERSAVWSRVTTFEGINHEFGPLLRMTAPGGLRQLDAETVPLGEPLGRCWVLALGFIPIDYDDLTIVELEPGRRFLERSKLGTQRVWEHERTLTTEGGSTRLTDRLRFEPRIRGSAALSRFVVAAIFGHRHRRLAGWFGAPERAPG